MEAIALDDYTAETDEELSFKRRAIIKILSEDGDYYNGEVNGRSGIIHKRLVRYQPSSWFRPKMSKAEAEEFLMKFGKDGVFVIRESESSLGDFSISVWYEKSVKHLKILRDGVGKYFLFLMKFNSVNDLVGFHRMSTVSLGQNIHLRELETARALFDFEGRQDDELTFKTGDVILSLFEDGQDWWKGEFNGKIGFFPKSYVTIC